MRNFQRPRSISFLILVTTILSASSLSYGAYPYDQRRCDALKVIDDSMKIEASSQDASKKWIRIKGVGMGEARYLNKIISIFALVQNCGANESRRTEAENLLRYMTFSLAPSEAGRVAFKNDTWGKHRVSLAMRLFFYYKEFFPADVRGEWENRMTYLSTVDNIFDGTENIILFLNTALFLADEYKDAKGSNFAKRKKFLVKYLKDISIDGQWEWGSDYQFYTRGAILNLVDFAKDEQVRSAATTAMDIILAQLAETSIGFYSASARVRMYAGLGGGPSPAVPTDNELTVSYFGDHPIPASMSDKDGVGADYIVTNYRPLKAVEQAFLNQTPMSEIKMTQGSIYSIGEGNREKVYRHPYYIYRGNDFAVGSLQRPGSVAGSPHGFMPVFIQTSKGPDARVFPWSFDHSGQVAAAGQRAFGYKTSAFVVGGTEYRREDKDTKVDSGDLKMPASIFVSNAISIDEIIGCWAFMTDGNAYIAWATTVGKPVLSTEHTVAGRFIRSSYLNPEWFGEVTLFEVGDKKMYSSLAQFKNSVLKRSIDNCPDTRGVKVSWKTYDGRLLEFGKHKNFNVWLDGVVQPVEHPRFESEHFKNGLLQTPQYSVQFDMINGRVPTGQLDRVDSSITWGN